MSRLRALLALVAMLAATVLLPVVGAAPAQAAPWCDDEVPLPATPLSGGGFSTTPPNVSDADPFADPTVPIQNVYGWHYKMVTYDTGCTPGSSLMPRTGTEIANGLSEPVGTMASVGHGLMSAVISPTWLEPIDAGVAEGVKQVRAGTWFPYVGLVVLLVGAGMLWSTRRGRLDASTTAGVWALIVLGLTTYLGSYPLHATQMVDGAVQEATLGIATSFSTDPDEYGPPVPGNGAQQAIDEQWNSIVRSTTYRTWAEGMFGSATSQTALTHGPDLFAATHLTWTEAAALDSDPSGAGQGILDAKAEDFKAVAESIESADPYAYSHLQGKHWGSRLSAAGGGLVAGVLTMLFLLVAPIGMFVGYVVIRVAVMFSPAAGLLFMVEKLRNVALGLVAKVGRFVVMGPLWLLGALVVLRLNSSVLNAGGVAFWLQLLLCLVVSWVAWQLLKPVSGIPGLRGLHRVLRTAAITATGWRVGNAAGRVGRQKGRDGGDDAGEDDRPPAEPDQVVYTAPSRPALGPALPREGERQPRQSGERVDWGDLPVQRPASAEDQEAGEGAAAAGGRPRGGLMGRPVAMSSRRVRHLSGSAAAAGALTAGTRSQEQPAATVDESAAGHPQAADAGQSAVFDQGETRADHRGATVVPLALPVGAGGHQEPDQQDDEAQDAPAAGAGEERRGTFAPRRGPALLVEDGESGAQGSTDAVSTQGVAGGVVMTAEPRPPVGGGLVDDGTQQSVGEAGSAAPADPAGDIPPAPEVEARGTLVGPSSSAAGAGATAVPHRVEPEEHRFGATASTGHEVVEPDVRIVTEEELPSDVHEANVTVGSDGKPVFQVYRPQGGSVVRRVD